MAMDPHLLFLPTGRRNQHKLKHSSGFRLKLNKSKTPVNDHIWMYIQVKKKEIKLLKSVFSQISVKALFWRAWWCHSFPHNAFLHTWSCTADIWEMDESSQMCSAFGVYSSLCPRAGRRIEMIWDLTLPENMVIFRMNVTLFFLKLQYQTEKNMIPFSGSSYFIILDGACWTMSSTGSFSQILRNQKRLYPICSHIFDMKLFKKLFYDFLHFFKHCSLLRQLSTSDWHSVKHCWECATVHEKINKNSTKRRATRSRLSREPRSLSSHRPRENNRSPNEEEDGRLGTRRSQRRRVEAEILLMCQ